MYAETYLEKRGGALLFHISVIVFWLVKWATYHV